MISDEQYDICLPVLRDATLEDEDKTDRLEEVLRKHTKLTGPALDNVILDALWRYHDGASSSPPPIRQSLFRRPSPAPWRGSPACPRALSLSPSPRLAFGSLAPPGFAHSHLLVNNRSSITGSPFGSPRPSPRMNLAQPAPLSPRFDAYQYSHQSDGHELTPAPEILAEFQIDNVDWIVAEDTVSVTSSAGLTSALNAAAPEFSSSIWTSSTNNDMCPFDILRCILGQSRSDGEIENALALNGYDLGATIASIMESNDSTASSTISAARAVSPDEVKTVLVGKSINIDLRPVTPVGQQKFGVICKFFLSTGHCLRSDCRFSHDLGNHLCKYWVMGSCLAGDACVFSHDPTQLVSKLSTDRIGTPPHKGPVVVPIHDQNSFPSLSQSKQEHLNHHRPHQTRTPPPGMKLFSFESPLSRSRPGSRHQAKEFGSVPSADDAEAFPSLGFGIKQGKRQHGKRGGHALGHILKDEPGAESLLDVSRLSLGNGNGGDDGNGDGGNAQPSSKRMMRIDSSGTIARDRDTTALAEAIPGPKHIPWLETGERANEVYLKARQDALRHGSLRNKYLQSAAQYWGRKDTRGAKALSLRGSSENELMRQAHRKAARSLYEGCRAAVGADNTDGSDAAEIYVDLHGLQPEEAVRYLELVLIENGADSRPVYAIIGSGHHSRNGKDKAGRAVRTFLIEWNYTYREFAIPGDRNSMGGILGIDTRTRASPSPPSVALAPPAEPTDRDTVHDALSGGVEIGEGRVRLLVRGPPRGPSAKIS